MVGSGGRLLAGRRSLARCENDKREQEPEPYRPTNGARRQRDVLMYVVQIVHAEIPRFH